MLKIPDRNESIFLYKNSTYHILSTQLCLTILLRHAHVFRCHKAYQNNIVVSSDPTDPCKKNPDSTKEKEKKNRLLGQLRYEFYGQNMHC